MLLAALGITGAAAQADAPQRVVSVNLCTDQLALDLAAPGQLVSVSRLAHDPKSSARVEKALALPTNGSGAEEVFMLNPDLVLAGTFTDPATVSMLRDLGIPVVLFAPAQSLSDVPDRIAQMGRALGREAEADRMIAAFKADLSALQDAPADRPRAALYYVNSYTSGDKSLAGDILNVAGFENAATQAGISTIGTLPLEQLILLAPDIIIQGRDYPGQSRSEDNFNHPALHALTGTVMAGELTDRDWICGTPQVLNAIRAMRDLRIRIGGTQ
ncbi:Vitamin B12-binding protein (plasmid) [Pseudoseohaeicola sp. NH-UV-7]